MTSQKVIYTRIGKAFLLEPHIVQNEIFDNFILDVDDAYEFKKANIELTGDQPYAAILTFGHLSEATQKAREIVASREFKQKTIAKAIIVKNIGHRLIGNFYLTVNKPSIKTKLFTEREPALIWLRGELAKAEMDSDDISKSA